MLNIIMKIWKLIPALLGAVQGVLFALKELAVIVIRIVDVITLSETIADKAIAGVNGVYAGINDFLEMVKNKMLGL